jgi:O-methyltransferase
MQTLKHPQGLRRVLNYAESERRYRAIFRKFRNCTQIPQTAYVANLRLAATIRYVSGSIVECGTWRGGMIAGIAAVLGPERHYRLFDSYEGMPPAQEIDGAKALAWEQNTTDPAYHNNCRACEAEAAEAMRLAGAKKVTITKGWFRDTLPKNNWGPVALLRVDADWYDSTMQILENFANMVVSGGLILVDDYYLFEGCTLAVNEWAARKKWMIHESKFGEVCYIRVS